MPTYRLDLSYDGSGFRGYARQPDVRTVQGELEAVLARIVEPVDTVVAGRTDAGVHARHQVVSFFTAKTLQPDRLAHSLTKLLGPEVAVYAAAQVPDDFSARFSATRRTYHYRILNSRHPDPLRRAVSWHVKDQLDLRSMNRALEFLVGEHDFASFCRRREGASTVRTMLSAGWSARPDSILELEIAGTAFCHQMVRSVVAFTVEVGRGRVEADTTPAVIRARDRNAARGAAPPHGLVLWQVDYPGEGSGIIT